MDIVCQAKSGMGKTAVFVLATLQQLEPVDGEVGAFFHIVYFLFFTFLNVDIWSAQAYLNLYLNLSYSFCAVVKNGFFLMHLVKSLLLLAVLISDLFRYRCW